MQLGSLERKKRGPARPLTVGIDTTAQCNVVACIELLHTIDLMRKGTDYELYLSVKYPAATLYSMLTFERWRPGKIWIILINVTGGPQPRYCRGIHAYVWAWVPNYWSCKVQREVGAHIKNRILTRLFPECSGWASKSQGIRWNVTVSRAFLNLPVTIRWLTHYHHITSFDDDSWTVFIGM